MDELINEPTHIRDDGSQTCIALICTDQPFLFVDSGVLPSLDPHSKHNITHGRLNFQTPSPPPYKRRIWDYNKAKIEEIRRSLSIMNWPSLFNQLSANEMALVFTDTVLDIFSKNIPNKTIICHDKDAAWITPQVKAAIKRNSRVYAKWNKRGRRPEKREKVVETQNLTSFSISISIYFGKSYSVHYIPSATQGTRKHITTTTKFGTNIHNIKNI